MRKFERRRKTISILIALTAALVAAGLWLLLLNPWSAGEDSALAVRGDPAIHVVDQLSGLPVPTFSLAIDEAGRIWLPQFGIGGLKNDGTQVNELWRFDPASDELVRFPLPGRGGVNTTVRITTRGSAVYVGSDRYVYRIDVETGTVKQEMVLPLDSQYLPNDGRPPLIALSDMQFAPDGSLWIAREGYSALTKLAADGAWTTVPLPPGYGEPHSLAVDDRGHVWASVIRHAPTPAGPGLEAVNAFAITVEFDPVSGRFTKHAMPAGKLAMTAAGDILAVGGGPGGLRSLEREGAAMALSDQAGTSPEDHVVVAPDGTIWYTAIGPAKIVRRAPDGTERVFSLPSGTASAEYTHCPAFVQCPDVVGWVTHVGGIALASNGDLWFTVTAGAVAIIIP